MKFKITIKEVMCEKPIVSYYTGEVSYEYLRDFYGCLEPDVEWFTIEREE